MNLIDLAVLLLLLLGIVSGARAGFLGPVLGLIGAIGGFAIALVLASVLREPLANIEQPLRARVTLGGPPGPWLLGGMLSMGMAPTIGAAAQDSVAIRLTSERLPPPTAVAGRLLALLDSTDLPPLFAGIEPPAAAPVALPPDAETQALAQSALASTARITSTGCGVDLSVGSGFFVSGSHAITNAHVIAGSSGTTVTLGEATFDASVVAIDTAADLALIHVPGANAPALQLSPRAPARGTAAAALGYPGGGELTVTAAAVTATYEIPGPNIYGEGRFSRNVVEMRSAIRRGNSGGPLVVAPGVVGAVVFGASRVDPEVGYAIGSDEAVERIGPYIGSTAAVDTGACL